MNTYLLPICFPGKNPEIISLMARSYRDAQDKFMSKVCNKLQEDLYYDWNEFIEGMEDIDCLIGEIIDKDEIK